MSYLSWETKQSAIYTILPPFRRIRRSRFPGFFFDQEVLQINKIIGIKQHHKKVNTNQMKQIAYNIIKILLLNFLGQSLS
jgi:hypothetical protein